MKIDKVFPAIVVAAILLVLQETFANNIWSWDGYQIEFNKLYNSTAEKIMAESCYRGYLFRIDFHNANYALKRFSYELRPNQFTDRPARLFINQFAEAPSDICEKYSFKEHILEFFHTPPMEFDYRLGNYTEILDQKFAIRQSLYFAKMSARGTLKKIENSGKPWNCKGSDNATAIFDFSPTDRSNYIFYPWGGDLEKLKIIVACVSPVVVQIDPNSLKFEYYGRGIFTKPQNLTNHKPRFHYMTVIGYGTSKRQFYWILQNSFGTKWGEHGYMRISGKDAFHPVHT